MQRTSVIVPAIKLVGISVRTSYQQEMDKMKGHIFPCVQRYFHGTICDKIAHRKKPGTTYCVYTDYETDHRGTYTYFIGEEVASCAVSDGLQTLTIPEQDYVKFTSGPAPMPDVITGAWQAIWAMSPKELGGKRRYHSDFEIYDERAADHQNIVCDVYVGMTA